MSFDINDQVVDEAGNAAICMWFAKCANPANGLRPHPILGPVPTCKRCDDRMNSL